MPKPYPRGFWRAEAVVVAVAAAGVVPAFDPFETGADELVSAGPGVLVVKPVVDPLIAQRRVELVRTGRSYADRVLRLAERQLF